MPRIMTAMLLIPDAVSSEQQLLLIYSETCDKQLLFLSEALPHTVYQFN